MPHGAAAERVDDPALNDGDGVGYRRQNRRRSAVTDVEVRPRQRAADSCDARPEDDARDSERRHHTMDEVLAQTATDACRENDNRNVDGQRRHSDERR